MNTDQMITCNVCNTSNHHLAILCSSCGGYLQGRVDNLDLFATGWKIIESPLSAMRIVALARHKNYAAILSAIAGIALTFFIFWLYKLGDHAQTIVNVLGAGLVVGPIIGIIVVLLYSAVITLEIRVSRMQASFRNIFATVSYALVPLVLSVFLVLPIEVMTFGTYFFTSEPSPYLLKPASYILLLSLDGIFALWSIMLLFIGMKTLLDISWARTLNMTLLSLLMFGFGMKMLLQVIIPNL
jgi:hypothetical protein